MKKVQKVLALLLAFGMILTSPGLSAAATESVEPAESVVSQEGNAVQEQDSTDILEYVYVDETMVNIPQTQNIAVAFTDQSLILESAVLQYRSVVTGASYEMQASSIVDNTVLFTQDYPEGSAEDVVQLESLSYQSAGETHTVNLMEEQIDAGYTVSAQPEKEIVPQEAMPDVAVYSLNEEGDVIKAASDTENIENAVAEVLEEADPISEQARGARANKTVVICAGHDATHTGAQANGLKEEQLTFKVAQYCKQALEQYQGVTVLMDRSSISCKYPGQSTSYCLNQRVKDAAANGATVFVDIHFNTGGGTGAEVYYPNKSYNEGISQEGKKLADEILKELSALGLKNRGSKIKDGTTGETDQNGNKDDYFTTNYLSKQYGMTGIIVEHAFLDHASDAAKLKDESFLKKLGEADAAGIAATYGFTKGGGTTPTPPSTENASVRIENKNDFDGTAQIQVSGVGDGAKVAVWSDVNGQDDLQWYSVSGNSGVINFKIKNHKNSTGNYNVHVYNSSSSKILCNTTFRISSNTSAKLSVASVNGREDLHRAQVKFADMPDEVTGVQIPVWSKADQSDIRWLNAAQKSRGVWEVEISLSNYKVGDTYQVHAYATLSNGTQHFLDETTFKVTGPSAAIKVQNYNASAGTFDVLVQDVVVPGGVKEVQVPVWNQADQSDIVWYSAKKQSDRTYKVSVDIKNHKNHTGTYNIHVYAVNTSGSQIFLGATTQKVENTQVQIVAKDTNGKEMKFELSAKNVGQSGVKGLNFAVWSDEKGQDDIIWYEGKKQSSGTWSTEAVIANHKTAGVYQVHVYSTDGKTQKFVGNTTFKVSAPTGKLEIQNYSAKEGRFEVILKNVTSKSGISAVQIPVWSKSNQSDIKWYQAKKQSDGTYKVTVEAKNHSDKAQYSIHAYVTAENGIMQFVDSKTQRVNTRELEVTAANPDGKEKKYTVTVENTDFLGNVTEVQFATWSEENGQDDIIWYQGLKKNSSVWVAEVDVAKHKTAGTYNVHVYGMIAGKQEFLGSTIFKVSNPKGTLEVRNYNPQQGSMDVIVKNVASKSGVQEVQIPVWSQANQSDICWYSAQKQGDGTYKVTIRLSDHDKNATTYMIHGYITTENGIKSFIDSTEWNVPSSGESTQKELTPIMGSSETTVDQMVRYYESSRNIYPAKNLEKGGASTLREFCQIYYEEATAEGVKAEVAFTQAMKETAWLKFGGIVKIEQFNFAGIGAEDGNEKGQAATFADVRTGIRAHIQHLKAYGSTEKLKNECVDPRFKYVTRNSAPYVEWLGIKENPNGIGWATDKDYGYKIVDMMNVLKSK